MTTIAVKKSKVLAFQSEDILDSYIFHNLHFCLRFDFMKSTFFPSKFQF